MHDDFLQVAKGPFLAKGDLSKLLAKTLGEEMAGKLGKEVKICSTPRGCS